MWRGLASGRVLPDVQAGAHDIAMDGIPIRPGRAAVASFSVAANVDRKRPVVRCADHGRFVLIDSTD